MAMPHASQAWTAERVRAIPDDGNRYELIDGELVVTPAPRYVHQDAILELIRLLDPWLRNAGTAKLLMSPADISLGEDEILQPDLFVYRTADGKSLREWKDITSLLLVIEVLSPSTARYDRQLKRRRYQRQQGTRPQYKRLSMIHCASFIGSHVQLLYRLPHRRFNPVRRASGDDQHAAQDCDRFNKQIGFL